MCLGSVGRLFSKLVSLWLSGSVFQRAFYSYRQQVICSLDSWLVGSVSQWFSGSVGKGVSFLVIQLLIGFLIPTVNESLADWIRGSLAQ